MNSLVLDTSVLVDIFNQDSGRHPSALKLANHIVNNNYRVTLPYHALFELGSSMKREIASLNLNKHITEKRPLLVNMVPIDDSFLQKYMDTSVPYLKAGDLLFVLIAKKEGLKLITEDVAQYEVARAANVEVYKIQDYLNTHDS